MIRMITCDIDGTLLQEGDWELSDRYFPIIRDVLARGIVFAVASGRQHDRLRRMFAPVAEEIFFICENGAVVFDGDRLLSETPLDPQKAHALIDEILAVPDMDVMISGAEQCYLLPKSDEYVHLIRDLLGYRTQVVTSVDEIAEPIIKVSAHHADIRAVAPRFDAWSDTFQIAVAGQEWLDFTLSDKGTGLDDICRATGIDPKDVMSFGDNFNDLPLMQKVGHPYLMENAVPELKALFPCRCRDVGETLLAFLSDFGKKISKTS